MNLAEGEGCMITDVETLGCRQENDGIIDLVVEIDADVSALDVVGNCAGG